jgi:hypothetical protein
VREILKSMRPRGELTDAQFEILMQGSGAELLEAALLIKPSDPRGALLLQRYKDTLMTQCERCNDTQVVTLFDVDVGGGFQGDADEQPCPECSQEKR